jgi:CBS domain-containing protein
MSRYVADVMSAPMLTLDGDAPIEEAARAMLEAGINSVVVVNGGCKPMGIFTSTDVLEAVADHAELGDTAVETYATSPVETVAPGDTVAVAADQMRAGEFSHLPVVDDDGDGVGVLTQTDLTNVVADAPEGVEEAIES